MKKRLIAIACLTFVAGFLPVRPTAAMPAVTGTGCVRVSDALFSATERTRLPEADGVAACRSFAPAVANFAGAASAGRALVLSGQAVTASAKPMRAEPALSEPPQHTGQPLSDARATELLERVAAAFRAMPSYGVDFRVEAGEYTARGNYAVEGERYYIGLGDAEVYSDGSLRYEVDNRRREVTLTPVDTASRNLLNNPVHAFDFLGAQYAATLLSEQEGRAVVLLAPTGADSSPAGAVTLTIDVATMKPLSLAYDYDGERVGIEILSVAPLTTSLLRFDATNYPGYETIDFR